MNRSVEAGPTRSRILVGRLFALGRTRTGVLALTAIGTLLVRTISSMTLTRLLRPDDFGIVGIIGSVFFTAAMFTDLGFQAFLVRHQRTEERHFRDVIWTIHAKRGIALFALTALTSPLIAWLFGKPTVTLPLAVASATFALEGLASLSLITALRQDKSRELSLFDLGLQVFQTVASIVLALWLRNVWAMIAAMMLQSSARTFLSYRLFSGSSQRLASDPAIFREFLAFSRVILVSSILTLMLAQSDKIVLARLFSLRDFGLYSLAISITTAPKSFALSFVTRVAFPVYAQTWRERPSALGNTYYSVKRRASILYALGCGALIGGAPLLIAILYDPRYAAASTYISLIMISVALQITNTSATELLTAAGEMKALVHVNLVRLVWLAIAMPLGFWFGGPIGIVAAVGLIEMPATMFNWILLQRLNVLDWREELLNLGLIGGTALIASAGSTLALRLMPHL